MNIKLLLAFTASTVSNTLDKLLALQGQVLSKGTSELADGINEIRFGSLKKPGNNVTLQSEMSYLLGIDMDTTFSALSQDGQYEHTCKGIFAYFNHVDVPFDFAIIVNMINDASLNMDTLWSYDKDHLVLDNLEEIVDHANDIATVEVYCKPSISHEAFGKHSSVYVPTTDICTENYYGILYDLHDSRFVVKDGSFEFID